MILVQSTLSTDRFASTLVCEPLAYMRLEPLTGPLHLNRAFCRMRTEPVTRRELQLIDLRRAHSLVAFLSRSICRRTSGLYKSPGLHAFGNDLMSDYHDNETTT